MKILSQKPIATGLVVAIALGATLAPGVNGTANAAPLSINSPALKEAVPDNVIDVRRYRGYGWGGGAAVAGLALGFMGAAIAARQYDRYYGYGPGYGYGPYYGTPYYSSGYYGYRPYRYRPYRYYGYRHYRPYRYYW